jgi:hypothetical protein
MNKSDTEKVKNVLWNECGLKVNGVPKDSYYLTIPHGWRVVKFWLSIPKNEAAQNSDSGVDWKLKSGQSILDLVIENIDKYLGQYLSKSK